MSTIAVGCLIMAELNFMQHQKVRGYLWQVLSGMALAAWLWP